MRVMTTRLPWAWLIVNGFKRYELRSRQTNIRERVAIRSSRLDAQWARYVRQNMSMTALPSDARLNLMKQSILGTAQVVDCIPIEKISDVMEGACLDPEDYGGLAYAWLLEDPESLSQPLPWKAPPGAVTWSNLPVNLESHLRQ